MSAIEVWWTSSLFIVIRALQVDLQWLIMKEFALLFEAKSQLNNPGQIESIHNLDT